MTFTTAKRNSHPIFFSLSLFKLYILYTSTLFYLCTKWQSCWQWRYERRRTKVLYSIYLERLWNVVDKYGDMTIDTQLLHFLIIIIKLYIFPRQDFFFFFCGFHFSSPSPSKLFIFFFFRFVDFLFIPSPRVAVLFVVHFSSCFSFFFYI